MTTNPSASFFASSGSSSNSFASVGTEWTSTLRFYDYRQGNTFVVPEKYRHDDLPKLSHLIGDDIVVEMYSHTGKLFEDWSDTTSILHHAFVVFKTVNFKVNNNKQVKQVIWYSIEKNRESIVLQRADTREDVVMNCENMPRDCDSEAFTELPFDGGHKFVFFKALYMLYLLGELKETYSVIHSNCQHFVELFRYLDFDTFQTGFSEILIQEGREKLTNENKKLAKTFIQRTVEGVLEILSIIK